MYYNFKIKGTLRSTDKFDGIDTVDRKVNLIFYTMEIYVRRSLSALDCILLYVDYIM